MGENNTLAGFRVLNRIFSGIPYSGGGNPYHQGALPYGRKSGGSTTAHDDGVKCVLAGGEYVVSPAQVAFVGGGDPVVGHKILDAWVERQKLKTAKTIKNLPPPVKD
jgi:hypothetical protein